MRVLHIDTGTTMRGGQHQVLLLLKGLRESGHDSALLATPESPLFLSAAACGFIVHPSSVSSVFARSRWAELVHTHDARSHTLAAVASRCPFVSARRVAFPVKRGPLSKWKYKQARRYLAVSHHVQNQLENAGVPSAIIDWVPDGVEFTPGDCWWNFSGPIVALDSEDPQKGRDLVDRAAKLAGVKILFSNALASELNGSSLLVYITRNEGLGSAALLAMSYGVPVIASRVGGLAELFTDGVSGLYVANDPVEIAAAIRRVMRDRDLAASLSRNSQAHIEQNFTREHLVARTLESYRRALAG